MGIRSLVVPLRGELIGNKSEGNILEWLNVPPFEYTQKSFPKAHTPLSVVYSQTNYESYCLENILNRDGVVSCTVSDYRKLIKLFPNHEWISRLVNYISINWSAKIAHMRLQREITPHGFEVHHFFREIRGCVSRYLKEVCLRAKQFHFRNFWQESIWGHAQRFLLTDVCWSAICYRWNLKAI